METRQSNECDADAARRELQPNPEAIAWYVEEAQRLLDDQHRRAESLRTRGGQMAGFGAAVVALIGSNATSLLDPLDGAARTAVGGSLISALLCLAVAVIVAIWGALRPRVFTTISTAEITRYTDEAFLTAPDLWRIHVRSLHALDDAAVNAQQAGDSAERAIESSLRAFLAGLSLALIGVATLLAKSIS